MPNSKFKRLQEQAEESIRRGRGQIEPAGKRSILTWSRPDRLDLDRAREGASSPGGSATVTLLVTGC